MMETLCVYAISSGEYNDYIPLWEYSLIHSYPEYEIKHEIVDGGIKTATLRFLNQIDTNKDYIYITDIDMMILTEKPSLLEFHLNEIINSGLIYSNTLRKSEPLADDRITGLHFFENKKWYKKTYSARSKYRVQLNLEDCVLQRYDDEIILKNIIVESGLKLPQAKLQLIPRHHGIHMGTLRAYKNHTDNTINSQLLLRITKQKALQWIEFYKDKTFIELLKKIRSKNIRWEYEYLYAFCKRMENMK